MPTIIARKFFSRRVSIVGAVAISYADLMRSAPAVTGTPVWGTNANGSKSGDAFIADYASAVPATETLFVGYDARVADADAAASYKGANINAGDPFNSSHYFRGPVDTSDIWFYSANTQDVDLIFQGI